MTSTKNIQKQNFSFEFQIVAILLSSFLDSQSRLMLRQLYSRHTREGVLNIKEPTEYNNDNALLLAAVDSLGNEDLMNTNLIQDRIKQYELNAQLKRMEGCKK